MADLFISHSSVDVEWTRDLRRQLEAAGYTCWMAPDDMVGPTPWAEQILNAIEQARVMIVVISRAANASNHVSKEVGVALEFNKPLLPIRVEDIVPTGSLNYLLQLVQWVDAFPGALTDHLDRIRRAVAYSIPPPPTPPGDAAAPMSPPAPPAVGYVPAGAPVQAPPVAAPAYPVAAPAYPVAGYPAAPAYPATPAAAPAGYPAAAPTGSPRTIGTSTIVAGIAVIALAVVAVAGVTGAFTPRTSPTPGPTLPVSGAPSVASVPPSIEVSPTPQPSSEPSGPPSIEPSGGPSIEPPSPSASVEPSPSPEPSAFTAAELESLIPTSVDSIVLAANSQRGDAIFGDDAGSTSMKAFLASKGRTAADLIGVSARDRAGTADLQVFLFYVPGVDADELLAAIVASGRANVADLVTSPSSIGGRRVTKTESGTDPPTYLYTDSGIVFAVQTSDATVAADTVTYLPQRQP